MNDDKLVEKVKALLAKAESTEFEEERNAFLDKANELIVKHEIDAAVLRDEVGDPVVSESVQISGVLNDRPASLLNVICRAFRIRCIQIEHFRNAKGARTSWAASRTVTVVGHRSTVDLVLVLWRSLHAQMLLAQATERSRREVIRSRSAFLRNFQDGFIARAGQRLFELNETTTKVAEEGGYLPVLVDREKLVQDAFDELYPDRRSSRNRGAGSSEGFTAGVEAGGRADLGQRRLGDEGPKGLGR